MIEPLALFEAKPEQLQSYWPFIRRGLEIIKRKIKPDWLPEDIYGFLASDNSRALIAQRGSRLLGYVIYCKDLKPHSKQPVLFIRAAWNLPLKEQIPGDRMDEAVLAVWRCLETIAKTQLGTSEIAWWTTAARARAFERKYGWKAMHTSFYVRV